MPSGRDAALQSLLAGLPPYVGLRYEPLSCAYGAQCVAAGYCRVPEWVGPVPGHWQHGWISRRRSVHPAMIIGGWGSYEDHKASEAFWVARRDQEELLRRCGYVRARAIGMPITYLEPPTIPRLPGRLLVMPVHSLDTTSHAWKFDEYADYIDSIRDRFASVAVCVHRHCIEKGYWYPQFKRRGYAVIEGASGPDSNSLRRLGLLLRAFEFVTTNGYGSHLVYAALFGARVSIAGPYASIRKEDYADTPLYREVPEILDVTLQAASEASVRADYPFLFCEPDAAAAHEAWGRSETGYDCRVSRRELRALFGWTYPKVAIKAWRRLVANASRALT